MTGHPTHSCAKCGRGTGFDAMIYCETSLMVAAMTAGPDSVRVQDWLARQEPGTLYISDLVTLEFSSALNQMMRHGLINRTMKGTLISQFHTITRETFHKAEISGAAIMQATANLNQRDTELGAMDALHWAIAWQGRHTFATVDPVLAKAIEHSMKVIVI